MELKCLIYTSWARSDLRLDELEAIILSARINNPLQGISGVLIFNGSAFMQILEGVPSEVDELAQRLAADKRHTNMSIRHEQPLAARSFPDWAMAYLKLDDGTFIGEAQVERALRRDLPESIRNVVLGLVHKVMTK